LRLVTATSVIIFSFILYCVISVVEAEVTDNLGLNHFASAQYRIVCYS
jgi:hypothetical protein